MYSQRNAQRHDSYYSANYNPPKIIAPSPAQHHTSSPDIAPPDTFPFFLGSSIMLSVWINIVVSIAGYLIMSVLLIVTSFRQCFKSSTLTMTRCMQLTVMSVAGIGTTALLSNVLFLPDLQANLFSQKQAMREGASIILSADGLVFTVIPISGFPMNLHVMVHFGNGMTLYSMLHQLQPWFLQFRHHHLLRWCLL